VSALTPPLEIEIPVNIYLLILEHGAKLVHKIREGSYKDTDIVCHLIILWLWILCSSCCEQKITWNVRMVWETWIFTVILLNLGSRKLIIPSFPLKVYFKFWFHFLSFRVWRSYFTVTEFLSLFYFIYSGVCYNERCYNVYVLLVKSGCYNESGGILTAEVARACAWRVRPSWFY
jgi:hypothetical protein